MKPRCDWCGEDLQYISYHDHEWGVPCHEDRHLFEMLILEGAQAGLSWRTILRKRSHYRAVFDQFEVAKVAAYTAADVQRLLADPGIVRNRLKVQSAIRNAQRVLEIQQEFGSLDACLWRHVDHVPRQNAYASLAEIPARTEQSDRLSKDLKKRGLNFVGSTICYAFMQAVGMVNDHLVTCFRYPEVQALAERHSAQPPGDRVP
ncbi:MAG: DNA-3-methyladenine glycosylase I [Victivallales bacterium]|jgi:DNA-3-methyladenine glycosylase I|nr:DNA-3-methyladenine glycosylase I [Victivallales bacterium]MBT7166129.1 DNA-3-methyladenine glycosylase I [Victivallales bacterium]